MHSTSAEDNDVTVYEVMYACGPSQESTDSLADN
jgi:hypothetical protein